MGDHRLPKICYTTQQATSTFNASSRVSQEERRARRKACIRAEPSTPQIFPCGRCGRIYRSRIGYMSY
uniref:Uncharacterized protein n=1 Tax=Octopus bimaculoides TaxID=37653 RepID=A0A0L8GP13_OCTBM